MKEKLLDYLGNEISVGNYIVWSSRSGLTLSRVIGIREHTVKETDDLVLTGLPVSLEILSEGVNGPKISLLKRWDKAVVVDWYVNEEQRKMLEDSSVWYVGG